MVEVFKTNVQKKTERNKLLRLLTEQYPSCRINFDLSDRDRILRVEGEQIISPEIMVLVRDHGFHCEILD